MVSELGGDNTHNSKMFLNLGLTLHIQILRKQEQKSLPVYSVDIGKTLKYVP